MQIIFYGGLNEIGGNKILLKYKNTRLFLDFGKSFSQYSKFFEEYVQPRRINGLGDYLALGLIPPLEGLYRPDYLKMLSFWGNDFGLKQHSRPAFDAVLISHAHADHINFLSFIDPNIPVYVLPDTLKVIKTLDLISQESLEGEIFDYKERLPDGTLPRSKQKIKKIFRRFVMVKPYQTFPLKDVEVTFLPVEHSIPGCAMILIKGGFGTLLYSGDFRLGGPLEKINLTAKALKFLESIKIDWMLCEGTRIKERSIIHEEQVYRDIINSARSASQIIAIEYSFKDLTRFQTFLKTAKTLKRILVFPSEWFMYIKLLHSLGFKLPNDWNSYVQFFARRKITFKGSWERNLYAHEKKIYADDIRRNQNKIILGTSFYKITDLIDINPYPGSIYIQSTSEPFNEEMAIDLIRLKNWLKAFGIASLIKPHASGHISGKELEKVVERIAPRQLIPIHTENPKLFAGFHKMVLIVKNNEVRLSKN